MQRTDRRVTSLMLATILAVGAGTCWVMICVVIGEAIPTEGFSDKFHDDFAVLRDGTPVIRTTVYGPPYRRTARTLDGAPVELETDMTATRPGLTPELTAAHFSLTRESYNAGQLLSWPVRILSGNDREQPPEYWYLLRSSGDDGRAWFELYDSVTCGRIGFVGRDGLRFDRLPDNELFRVGEMPLSAVAASAGGVPSGGYEPSVRFSSTSVWDGLSPSAVYFVSDGDLLRLDLADRRLETLIEDAGLVAIGVAQKAGFPTAARDASAHSTRIVACSSQAVFIVDPATAEVDRIPLPETLQTQQMFVYLLEESILLHAARIPVNSATTRTTQLYWLAEDGSVVRERQIVLESTLGNRETTWLDQLAIAATVPVPAVISVIFLVEPASGRRPAASFPQAVLATAREHALAIAAIVLIALGAAVWCYRIHRRWGGRGGFAWFIFVLLLGPPGLIGYLTHRAWPQIARCPSCGRRVPRDRSGCTACGKPFPAPAATGTEILA